MQWVEGSISRLGTKALDSNGSIFTISELNSIEQQMQKPGFKMDPMAEYVGRLFGVDPLTVINRQRLAAGKKAVQLPEARASFSTTVSPILQRQLDTYQTPSLSTRAMATTRTFNPGLIPKGYGPMVVEAAQKAGINPAFVAAFAEAENTNWDTNALSMGGAAAGVGLMQLSQEFHGPGATRAERERALKDPRLNLTLGAGILSGIYKKYGNWKDTVYVWNMGETGFKSWVDAGRPNTRQSNYAKGLYERFEKARAKYGDVSALRSGGTMRPSMQRYGATSFERPSSINFESASGQPGVDLFFESKRFPAVLGGVVKDVSREPGYGNYVVIESVDPLTGQKVDVLYGHLADGVTLRPGQQVGAGDIIGTQGGTGNVRSADGTIASIDFLAPAPRGSKSMAPYSGFDNLRRYVVQQFQ
jgi:soluble lytic murein transglycosylase-like protein